MSGSSQALSTLFEAAVSGDEAAQKQLYSVLYSELHRLAHAAMRRERPGHVLQTTALVHEAYMRLVEDEKLRWENQAHFFKIAAGAMRRILVDEVRRNRALKRGGNLVGRPLDEQKEADPHSVDEAEDQVDVEALERAMQRLSEDPRHERKCSVVELHFFVGLTLEQIAGILEISVFTAKRDWRFAKAWLRREIDGLTGERHVG